MDGAEDRQSIRSALGEIFSITFGLSAVTYLCFFLTHLAPGADETMAMIVAAGQLFYDHLGWTMSIYLAALFALYAVVLGRQLIGPSEDGPRIRRRLGGLAEFIAAAALLLLLLVLAYLISDPTKLPMLAILIPIAVLMLALSVHLGTFAALDRKYRYLEALRFRSIVLQRLAKLGRQSKVPAGLVLLANAVVIAAIATALSLPFIPPSEASFLLAHFAGSLLLAAGALWALSVALYFRWTSTDAYGRHAFWGVPVTYYVFFCAVLWGDVAAGQVTPELQYVRLLSTAVLVLSVTAALWPRSLGGRYSVKWSLSGGVARSAAKTLQRESSKSLKRLDALLVSEPKYSDVQHWLLAGANKYRSEPLPSRSGNGSALLQ